MEKTNRLLCVRCGVYLEIAKASLSYLGSSFPVELYCCPTCKRVYVPQALAEGKMKQVEEALEDK